MMKFCWKYKFGKYMQMRILFYIIIIVFKVRLRTRQKAAVHRLKATVLDMGFI